MKLALVTPVFNDWQAFSHLIREIAANAESLGCQLDVLAVDDGSLTNTNVTFSPDDRKHIHSIVILFLACNVGHQRAIAIGLSQINTIADYDAVLVMDCDGEDRPQDIVRMMAAHRERPDAIIVAQRAKRSEGFLFALFYSAYKLVFRLATGRAIDFGNFCLIPKDHVERLTHMSELWNHLAGAVVRSRAPVVRLKTVRGHRYAGRSTMNFVSLIVHGLSAMAVFSDMLFVRTLVASLLLAALGVLGIVATLLLRFFTDLAIPGWATNVVGMAAIILLQGLTLSATSAFMILSNRSNLHFLPAVHGATFVRQTKEIS